MKITTWNVNSLTARLQHVLDWTAANPVDVLCLQELKLTDDKFPLDVFAGRLRALRRVRPEDLQRRRDPEPAPRRDVVKNIVGFADEHSRVIAATVDSPRATARGQRLLRQWAGAGHRQVRIQDELAARPARLPARRVGAHPRLVLLGDFNIAPEDRDSFDPEGLRETIHHTTEERDHFRKLIELGLCDSFRLFEQPEKSYSWWDYRMLGYQKNRGLRIDHILVSEALKPEVKGCTIDRVPRKWKQPSDQRR